MAIHQNKGGAPAPPSASAPTFIDPAADPRKAYDALLAGFRRLCGHDPRVVEDAVEPTDEAGAPELIPNPYAVSRESGHLAFTAVGTFEWLPGQATRVRGGDVIIVDPLASYGPLDTLLLAAATGEMTLIAVRQDGLLADLRGCEDPGHCLLLGVVIEVRRLSAAGKRKITKRDAERRSQKRLASRWTEEPASVPELLLALGSRDTDDFMPELLPTPSAVSQCPDGAGRALSMPGHFAMTVVSGSYDFPNKAGWHIQRGDTLIFQTDGESQSPYGVFLSLQDDYFSLVDGDMLSLRDGEPNETAVIIAPAVQFRPLGGGH